MGLDEIETTQLPPRNPGPGAASAPIQGYGTRVEYAAHRMRARGYSYRRISRELHVRYDLVTLWLSGGSTGAAPNYADGRIEPSFAGPRPTGPVSSAPLPYHAPLEAPPRPQVAPPAAELSEWLHRAASLEQRVKDLLASLIQLSQESREREARLYQAAEDARIAAKAREERYFDEMLQLRGTIKGLEQRIGYAAPATADPQAPRRFFWQRGRSE